MWDIRRNLRSRGRELQGKAGRDVVESLLLEFGGIEKLSLAMHVTLGPLGDIRETGQDLITTSTNGTVKLGEKPLKLS